MDTPAFAAAQQTSRMINREDKLAHLQQAICRPGDDTRVVIIEAAGGLGKTRLLYEVLWRAGNPNIFPLRSAPSSSEAWECEAAVSDPLDFSEARLHALEEFMERIRTALSWHPGVSFPAYDAARAAYRRRRKDQVDFSAIEAAAAAAEGAFFEDYQKLTQNYRLVWALDTAEQLSYTGAPWLRELLTPNDLYFSTRDQLLRLLKAGALPNTTILLAGRPSARDYFDELTGAAGDRFAVEKIELDVFTPQDTANYLRQLAQDYRVYETQSDYDCDLAEALVAIAADEERVKVLHRYTGGKPVLLSLFTDVLAEGKQEPAPLQDTPEEAEERIKAKSLETVQLEIEEAFINLIFAKTGDIRSQILTALVRARRGLDVKGLHFILGSKPGESYETWRGASQLRSEIEQALAQDNPRSVRYLSFVKSGFGERLILQDELYRIYDLHMARDETACQDETQARAVLYRQLQQVAETEIERLKQTRSQNREVDEASLFWESPTRALSKSFRYLGREEEDQRADLEDNIFEAELERLHYKLRLAPDEGITDWYLDVAEQLGRAGDLKRDVLAGTEIWRFIRYSEEEYWRAFIPLNPEIWQALEGMVAADEATQWIKRFWLRKKYERGIEFTDQVEEVIQSQPQPLRDNLAHPLFYGERACWKELGRTYLSRDIPNNITTLQHLALEMQRLLNTDPSQYSTFGLQPNTAQNRIRQVIGYVYNNLGYSLTTLGYYREAARAYTESLRYLRDLGFLTTEAVVRNNLSRVLSELGLTTRAIRICRDALALREELGYEIPIAGSHSTLALIYNNGLQPENAWVEAAIAVAYFRKSGDRRGLGLALFHLGEALRRLATSQKRKSDRPEQLFETAMEATTEALRLFEQSPEVMRRIETNIELGCLFRDYMYYLKQQPDAEQNKRLSRRITEYLDRALNTLNQALALAQQLAYPRHQLDAQVNLIWAHYYAGEIEETQKAFEDSLSLASKLMDDDQSCFLREAAAPPKPDKAEPYIFMLLGKAWTAKGRFSMDRFIQRQQEMKEGMSNRQARVQAIHQDQAAQEVLQEAAEAFVLALAYNELYSSRSPSIPTVFDVLYNYLKGFNRTELRDFYKYQEAVRQKYRVAAIEPVDLTDVQVFLEQSFGDYLKPIPGIEEVAS